MVVITLRIPEELKEEMKKRTNINWSEVAREAIVRKIEVEDRLEAVKSIEKIKKSIKPVDRGQLDKWIREDRER